MKSKNIEHYLLLLIFSVSMVFVFSGCKNSLPSADSETICNCEELIDTNGEWQKDDKAFTGKCKSYFPDGNIESEADFISGKIHGHLISYYPNGNVMEDVEYKNSIVSGQMKYYHENGQVSEEGEAINGSKEGGWKVYYENGQLMAFESWKNNLMVDSSIGYFRNGNLQIEGFWVNGKEEGKWTFYDSITGNIDGYLIFENGELIEGMEP